MKKLLTILLLLISSIMFAEKKFYVGTNGEFKPYEYLENGKLTGFDIEFMEMICKELNLNIEWVDMKFDGLIPALQSGKVDAVIAGMSQTEERKKAVEFSILYMFMESEHYLLVNEKSQLTKKEEIKDKKVGIQIGTIQEEFCVKLGGKPQLYNNWTGALMDLQAEKIDGVIISDASGKEYLNTMKGFKLLGVIDDKKPGASIAFKKGQAELAEQFNVIIKKLRDNGEYLKLLEKYFPDRVEGFKKMQAAGEFN
ncbi:transporter substrate-binding domain-containing protein [Fusobacterium sp. PH5-44]|uniref:transporter substrate-binding domain-containing protein n=1 Tax=unclassified Fusobacterium TaxID=2648384 RepID=UPI003D1D60C2